MLKNFRIDFVELESGNVPFEKFLKKLTQKERTEIFSMLDILVIKLNNSAYIPEKISKHLSDGIFEIRVKHFNRLTRSFYFFQTNEMLVLTHGFIKKTNSTPSIEIEKAKNYRKIYLKEKYEN